MHSRTLLLLMLMSSMAGIWVWHSERDSAPAPARVVVWTASRRGGAIRVEIDGRQVGDLVEYMTAGRPACAESRGALVIELPAGQHQLVASDPSGKRWRREVVVRTDECLRVRLLEDRDERPIAH